jgi:hypothetical protein
MQEMLHNFGLWHGWKDGQEYADMSSAMGFGDSCPSAPELWRLGWATPLAQLNSSNVPAGKYVTYTLPATAFGPIGVMIKIQPNWLSTSYSKYVYREGFARLLHGAHRAGHRVGKGRGCEGPAVCTGAVPDQYREEHDPR